MFHVKHSDPYRKAELEDKMEQREVERLVDNEGFQQLNPDPIYYNIEGAEPLMGIPLSSGSFQKKGEKEQKHYDILVMRDFVNGPRVDKDGVVTVEAEEIESGTVIRLGDKAQVRQYVAPLVGKAAMLLIEPRGKVQTSRGNSCWTFRFYARALSKEERKEALDRGMKFSDL